MDGLSVYCIVFTIIFIHLLYRVYVLVGCICKALRSLIHQFCSSLMDRHDNIYLNNIRFSLLNFSIVFQIYHAKKWFSTIYWKLAIGRVIRFINYVHYVTPHMVISFLFNRYLFVSTDKKRSVCFYKVYIYL